MTKKEMNGPGKGSGDKQDFIGSMKCGSTDGFDEDVLLKMTKNNSTLFCEEQRDFRSSYGYSCSQAVSSGL
jgi:hypothetical protein